MSFLNEAKDLNIYKRMLELFGIFVDKYPGTGMSKIYRNLMSVGMKCVPKDRNAQDMLAYVLSDNAPKSVQDLINTDFTDLPVTVRPLYRDGNKVTVAFWKKGNKLYSRTFDLLSLESEGTGHWCDEKGDKVDLLDLSKEG